jgi:homoserine dehydrogenase
LKPIRVGICGFGTVGGGTFNVLQRNSDEIARRTGCSIVVEQIAMRRANPNCHIGNTVTTDDIFAVANNPAVDVLVELIGGHQPAMDLIMMAISNGKHVVTANKALIAEYGNEIFAAARVNNVIVSYEAAVAGGIPIIKALREGLSANNINWLAGIINGTSNFILTEMLDNGRVFADVLKEAQQLGYAEADPTFDVDGIDSAHKLTILSSLAFGIPLQFSKCYIEGIRQISAEDVANAETLGYRIKHLGLTRRTVDGIELRVHPTLIPAKCLIANVHGVMNAVLADGDAVGSTLYYGAGAGAEPTASAIVADLVDVVRDLALDSHSRVPSLAFQQSALSESPVLTMEQVTTAFYLRMMVEERPGVLAQVTRILGERGISIEAIQQQEHHAEQVPVIILTRPVREQFMNEAIAAIESLADISGSVTRIRVEELDS